MNSCLLPAPLKFDVSLLPFLDAKIHFELLHFARCKFYSQKPTVLVQFAHSLCYKMNRLQLLNTDGTLNS